MRADAARNRARVLAAAQEVFAAEGIAVPLDEIARRAGVGAGTVYRHFPTKEALFAAVISERIRWHVEQARALAGAEDPGAAFFEFLDRMIAGAGTHKDLVDALAGADLDSVSAAKQELHRAVAVLLTRAQRAGAVRGDIRAPELMTLLAATTMALQQHPGRRDPVYAVLRDGLHAP